MEHILFEGVCCGFLGNTRLRIVEYTILTATCRTYVPASIAANTSGQFLLPECIPFVRCHGFQLCHLIEPLAVCIYFTIFAQDFITDYNLLALASDAAIIHNICFLESGVTIQRVNSNCFSFCCDAGYTFYTIFPNLIFTYLAITRNTDDIDGFPLYPVLCQQLVQAIRITRFYKNQSFSFCTRQLDQIL